MERAGFAAGILSKTPHTNPAHFLFAVGDITPLNIPVAFSSPYHTPQSSKGRKAIQEEWERFNNALIVVSSL